MIRMARKIFHAQGSCPKALIPIWSSVDKKRDKRISEDMSGGKKVQLPADMTVSREHHTVSLDLKQWANILKSLTTKKKKMLPSPAPMEKSSTEVEYMSSEKGTGQKSEESTGKKEKREEITKVCLRPVRYDTTFKAGQVLQVQMSAEANRGLLEPQIDLLQMSRNFSICIKHLRDPVKTLTRSATVSTKGQQFTSHPQYCQAWLPLLEMEAAVAAGDAGGAVVVEDVQVTMLNPTQGNFSLKYKFCIERNISVGGKSPDSIKREDSTTGMISLDYLCLRYTLKCPAPVVSRINKSKVPEIIENNFTWLAHAAVMDVSRVDCLESHSVACPLPPKKKGKGKKRLAETSRTGPSTADTDDTRALLVDFTLTHTSPKVPDELLSKKEGERMTVEILAKSEVERRAQEMLLKIRDCELARVIAFEDTLPTLEDNHLKLGLDERYHEVDMFSLLKNNIRQKEAIRKALGSTLTLIQGPPGTGKTYTGIKIIYLFAKINQQLMAEGKGKKMILFCGPSNKAVDLVAIELKVKLGDKCPKFVRAYSAAIEAKDYPTSRGDTKNRRGNQETNSESSLLQETLHHLIRDPDKPFAKDILAYEKSFGENPEKVTVRALKDYRKKVFDASVAEIKQHELVMTTCAVAGTQKLIAGMAGRVFQVIIDECGMCQEPHSMIPIIAAKARQLVLMGDHKQLKPVIKCQEAKDSGLEQSLFERLVRKFPSNKVFLNMQYRMHPAICQFPSGEFYRGKLQTEWSPCWHPMRKIKRWPLPIKEVVMEPLPFWPPRPEDYQFASIPRADPRVLDVLPIILLDVRGEEETLTVATDEGSENSRSNKKEADKVIEVLTYLKAKHKESDSAMKTRSGEEANDDANCAVALLTQYRAQKHLLKDKLHELCHRGHPVFSRYDKTNIKIGTVVSSQGGEWDYVILSLVRSLPSFKIEPNPTVGWCRQNLGFITDRNQANVALTRARRGLIIVGNVELLRCDQSWSCLVNRYEALGCLFQAADFPPPVQAPDRPRQRHTKHMSSRMDWTDV